MMLIGAARFEVMEPWRLAPPRSKRKRVFTNERRAGSFDSKPGDGFLVLSVFAKNISISRFCAVPSRSLKAGSCIAYGRGEMIPVIYRIAAHAQYQPLCDPP